MANNPLAATAETQLATPKISAASIIALVVTMIGLGAGVYTFFIGHDHAYAVTREVPWGILISTYAFFAITSTGLCLLAAIGHSFGGTPLASLGNRAVFLSIITIMSAFAAIGVELESPWRMLIYNVISPNLTSNIWWMGTLYGTAVGCMLLEFFSILTGNYRLALTIGIIGALAEVGANTNLGAVFATLSARPYWYGSQLPVYFLCSAVMSGAAAIIFFTYLAYKIRGQKPDENTFQGLQSAGKILTLTIFLLLVATVWRFISFFVGGTDFGRLAANALISGPLSINFWLFETIIGLIIPLVLLVSTQIKNVPAMAVAGIMALIGGFFQRYDIVVAGQLVPAYHGWDNLPDYVSYTPSAFEFLVVMGAIGLTFTGFLFGERLFGKVFNASGHH